MRSLSYPSLRKLPFLCLVMLALTAKPFLGQKRKSPNPPKSPASKTLELDLTGVDAILGISANWKPAAESNGSSYFYGKKTLRKLPKRVIRVWIKQLLDDQSDKGRSEFLRNRKSQGLRTSGYDKYSYTLMLYEFNCAKGEARVLSSVDYDEVGQVIDSERSRQSAWDFIVPDSVGDSMSEKVCRRPTKSR